jgi:hypothetical protein
LHLPLLLLLVMLLLVVLRCQLHTDQLPHPFGQPVMLPLPLLPRMRLGHPCTLAVAC